MNVQRNRNSNSNLLKRVILLEGQQYPEHPADRQYQVLKKRTSLRIPLRSPVAKKRQLMVMTFINQQTERIRVRATRSATDYWQTVSTQKLSRETSKSNYVPLLRMPLQLSSRFWEFSHSLPSERKNFRLSQVAAVLAILKF